MNNCEISKGVAIDGAGLWNAQRVLGITQMNFRGLIYCLQHKVGTELPFFQEPRSTIHPDFNKPGCRLYDDMRRAGILPRPSLSWNQNDDQRVMQWGSRYICADGVAETIVVTCDTEIVETLLYTAEMRQQRYGPHIIHVVGTCKLDNDGYSCMCLDLVRELQRSNFATFTDIADFQQHIGGRQTVH